MDGWVRISLEKLINISKINSSVLSSLFSSTTRQNLTRSVMEIRVFTVYNFIGECKRHPSWRCSLMSDNYENTSIINP